MLKQTGVVVGARARVHVRVEQLDQPLAAAKETLQLKRDAVAYDPATWVWNDGLATGASHLAVVHLRRGEFAPALEAVELARRVGAQLALDEGPASKWARQLPQLGTQQGFALAGMGLHAQALQVSDTALAYWEATERTAANERAWTNAARTGAMVRAGRACSSAALGGTPDTRDQAAAQARHAVAALRTLVASEGHAREAELNAAEALMLLAELLPAERTALRCEALGWLSKANTTTPVAASNALRLRSLKQDGTTP